MHLTRRDNLVYFRMPGDEFEAILNACHKKGARSVSDLHGWPVHEFINNPHNRSDVEMETFLLHLQLLIDELKRAIQQLALTVAKTEADNAQGRQPTNVASSKE